jgi:NADH:ubiquinone oxidoreductase subunit 2 (subunit N)
LLWAHVFIIAGIYINTAHIDTIEIVYYLGGIAAAFILGYYCLQKTKSADQDISLDKYHGYVYEQKGTAFLFLLSSIGILGFPVTMAFVGIDVFFTYVAADEIVLIALLALCFIFIELSAIRIFLRIYAGLHKKLNHPIAYRSS